MTASKGAPSRAGGAEEVFKRALVGDIAGHEVRSRGQQIALAVAEVVDNHWLVAPVRTMSSVTVPPMYPAPPVTKIFTKNSFPEI